MSVKASANSTAVPTYPLAFDAFYPGTAQNGLTSSGSSQQSTAVGQTTTLVRVYVSQDTYLAIGSNPTASSTTLCQRAGTSGSVEYYACNPGDKVAYKQVSTGGTVDICEGA